jgi:hypothetical protein
MSRKSILAMYASGSLASEVPMRGYFLSVGGALLLLLFAANWVLPAPSPGQPESQSTLPRIRIHSDVTGPEAVVIDTNRPLPVLAGNVIAAPLQQSAGTELIDGTEPPGAPEPIDGVASDRSTAPIPSHLRESWAKLGPPPGDQATTDSGRGEVRPGAPRRRTPSRSAKRRRSVRSLALDTPLSRCDSWSLERRSCRPAFTFPQMN